MAEGRDRENSVLKGAAVQGSDDIGKVPAEPTGSVFIELTLTGRHAISFLTKDWKAEERAALLAGDREAWDALRDEARNATFSTSMSSGAANRSGFTPHGPALMTKGTRMARAENDTEGLTEPQRLWVEALRSGKYKQEQSTLCRLNDGEPVGYCCLGVACAVAIEAGVDLKIKDLREQRLFAGSALWLPKEVSGWLGVRTGNGGFGGGDSLTQRNDATGATFEEIAALIESRPEGLFA